MCGKYTLAQLAHPIFLLKQIILKNSLIIIFSYSWTNRTKVPLPANLTKTNSFKTFLYFCNADEERLCTILFPYPDPQIPEMGTTHKNLQRRKSNWRMNASMTPNA